MTTIGGDPPPPGRAGDRFADPRVASRDAVGPTTGRGGFGDSDYLVALASSGRSIRLFTAPGGIDDAGRSRRQEDPAASN